MGGGLNLESNKVEDFAIGLIKVNLSVPDFDIDDKIISKTFQFVKDEVFTIFDDSLFGFN